MKWHRFEKTGKISMVLAGHDIFWKCKVCNMIVSVFRAHGDDRRHVSKKDFEYDGGGHSVDCNEEVVRQILIS